MKYATAILALVLISMPFLSMAHPGHGKTEGFTITHYLTEPEHVVPLFVIAMAALLVFHFPIKKKRLSQD